jgi:hypothetical protein
MRVEKNFSAVAALVLAAAVFLTGCAGVSGTIRRDEETTKIFEEGVILPDHTYYWSGIQDTPDGLLAVHSGFTLKTELWNAFEPGNGKLREMAARMREKGQYTSRFPFGSVMYADDGTRVGVWYSQADWTTVRMHPDNVVEITTPGKILEQRDRSKTNLKGGR